MKRLGLLAACIFCVSTAFGQIDFCQADSTFQDSMAGVYPLPYDAMENPEGGIPDSACLNKSYQFVFTAVVNDTLNLGATAIALDSLVLDSETALDGLPEGISYACNPPSCVFEANTVGCVVLYGTPTNSADLGDNELVITATIYGPFFPLGTDLTFPNDQLFPGSYSLYVHEEDYANCSVFTSTENVALPLQDMRNIPNPFSDMTVIELTALETAEYEFTVTNFMGATIHQQRVHLYEGVNQVEFNGSDLAAGVYLYTFRNQRGAITRKMVVQK